MTEIIKSIKITQNQWENLNEKLKQEYPPSFYLIREKMKRTIGFLPREHHSTDQNGRYKKIYILDFYSAKKQTLFLMKYSEIING